MEKVGYDVFLYHPPFIIFAVLAVIALGLYLFAELKFKRKWARFLLVSLSLSYIVLFTWTCARSNLVQELEAHYLNIYIMQGLIEQGKEAKVLEAIARYDTFFEEGGTAMAATDRLAQFLSGNQMPKEPDRDVRK